MPEKRKGSLVNKILKLVTIVPILFSLLGNLVTLVELEFKLAGRSLFHVIILSILACCLILTTWICLLCMLFLWLVSLSLSWQLSLLILVLANLFLLIIVVCMIVRHKGNLSFAATRSLLKGIPRLTD